MTKNGQYIIHAKINGLYQPSKLFDYLPVLFDKENIKNKNLLYFEYVFLYNFIIYNRNKSGV